MSGHLEVPVPGTLDPSTLPALSAAVDGAVRRPASAASTVVLRGDGETFCRGLDVQGLGDDGEARARAADDFVSLLLAIRRADRAFVAVVEGAAYGGGVGLAAACDVVIASRSATFGLPEVLFGLAPLTILPLLGERMTPQAVRRMALAGFGHTAERAADLGLVDEVAAPGELDAALSRWLRVLGRGRPEAVGLLKRRTADASGLESALREGAGLLDDLLRSSGAAARVAAWDRGELPWEAP